MELPIKGKDILATCADGMERKLFRCNCLRENCREWRCSYTGFALVVEVISWRYVEE